MKTNTCRLISIMLVVLLMASVFAFANCEVNVASAIKWGDIDTQTLWQYQESALNVDATKQAIGSWDLSLINEPIVIAVIDTGISTSHEIFDNTLLRDGDNKVVGYNVTKNSTLESDLKDTSSYHGTSVAGVMAMLIEELGLSNYIKIYPIKANSEDKDTFSIGNLIKAINKASETGADIVNLSLGFTESIYNKNTTKDKTAFEFAIENAQEDVVFVCAAGNVQSSETALDAKYYPAVFENTLSVMGYGKDGGIYKSSYYGSMYDIVAPGESIYSAKGSNEYATSNGTSMACASASVACALLKIRNIAQGKGDLDASEVYYRMRAIEGMTIQKGSASYRGLKLSSVATQDFDNIIHDYVNPTSISIVHNGEMGSGDYDNCIVTRVSKQDTISLVAKLSPIGKIDPDLYQLIEWKVTRINNFDAQIEQEVISIGKGAKVDFVPSRGGDFIISATLGVYNLTSEAYLHVEYGQYYVGEVRVTYLDRVADGVDNAPSSGEMYTHDTATFSLTGIEYVNPDEEIKWFVNGEYIASGRTFTFSPTKSGRYEITAQYGENKMVDFDYKFVVSVKSVMIKPEIICSIIGVCLVVAIVVARLCRKKKTKKAQEGAVDEVVDESSQNGSKEE